MRHGHYKRITWEDKASWPLRIPRRIKKDMRRFWHGHFSKWHWVLQSGCMPDPDRYAMLSEYDS